MSANVGSVRIIAGRWKHRKISFPATSELRPTMGTLRETIFAWLTSYLQGARCLDVFAGSGALGLEALSRGAAFALFFDKNKSLTDSILQHLKKFSAEPDSYQVLCGHMPECLIAQSVKPFDIVFLDPPYQMQDFDHVLQSLIEAGYVRSGGLIVFERMATEFENFSVSFKLLRSRRIGQTECGLLQYIKA